MGSWMYSDLSSQFIGPFLGHSFWNWPLDLLPVLVLPNGSEIMETTVKTERLPKEVLSLTNCNFWSALYIRC